MKPIALQLYSVRDEASKDFIGTIKKVAAMGYKGVEFAGLHDHDPKELAKVLKDLGLVCCSSHLPLVNEENVNKIVEQEQILGNKRLVTGFGPDDLKTEDDCKKAADKLNTAAELVKEYGMEIGYHNHFWEFDPKINGRYPEEIMFSNAADNVFAELDIYWVAFGKADPATVVADMKNRVPLLHVKDGILEKGKPFQAVGTGQVPVKEAIGAADPNVLDWLIVELDNCATDMMEAVEQSYNFLTSNKLAEGNK